MLSVYFRLPLQKCLARHARVIYEHCFNELKQSIKSSCCAGIVTSVCSNMPVAWSRRVERKKRGGKKRQEASALLHVVTLTVFCPFSFVFPAWCSGWNTAEKSIVNYASTDLLSRQVSKLLFFSHSCFSLFGGRKHFDGARYGYIGFECGPFSITVLSASVLERTTWPQNTTLVVVLFRGTVNGKWHPRSCDPLGLTTPLRWYLKACQEKKSTHWCPLLWDLTLHIVYAAYVVLAHDWDQECLDGFLTNGSWMHGQVSNL